ncbi:hypothetical protein QCD58_004613 [Enterobacter hormaechei]|nr:hypothetical protein [Enterobacter hormaechei]
MMSQDRQHVIFPGYRDRLFFYRTEIHYEVNALLLRTNSFLTAQSFLVIAYGSCMANLNPQWSQLFTLLAPLILALFGLLSCLSAAPGISATYRIIEHWQYKQDLLLNNNPEIGAVCDDAPLFNSHPFRKRSYRYSVYFSMRTPWMFFALWLSLGTLAVWLHYL